MYRDYIVKEKLFMTLVKTLIQKTLLKGSYLL